VAQIAELQSAGAAVTRRMASSISLQDVTQNESILRVPEPYRKMARNVFAFLYEFQRCIQLPDTAQPNWPKQASEAINSRRCTYNNTLLCDAVESQWSSTNNIRRHLGRKACPDLSDFQWFPVISNDFH